MPVLDGFAATRALRARGEQVKIIAITANSLDGDREACLAAGMDDYLAKPITLEGLQHMLDRYLDFLPGSEIGAGLRSGEPQSVS